MTMMNMKMLPLKPFATVMVYHIFILL